MLDVLIDPLIVFQGLEVSLANKTIDMRPLFSSCYKKLHQGKQMVLI